MKMKKNRIIGFALVAVAAVATCLIATAVGDCLARLVGKAVWYPPYAALIGAVRFFVAA